MAAKTSGESGSLSKAMANKTSAQLDAEIAESLSARKNGFGALITRIEDAVDAHPDLTRERRGGLFDEAELTFHHGRWTASCGCRNKLAKGRKARVDGVLGQGGTPEEAVDSLIEAIPYWAERMK